MSRESILARDFPPGKLIHGLEVTEAKMIVNTRFTGIASVGIKGKGDYTIVVESPGAGILLVTPQERIGLVQQVRIPAQTNGWEIILGCRQENKTAEETAVREAREEFDVNVDSSTFTKLPFMVHTAPDRMTCVIDIFMVLVDDDRISDKFDTNELVGKSLFTPKEVRRMIERNEITEAVTLTSLFWYFSQVR